MSKKATAKDILLLHVLFLIYSLTGVLIKSASNYKFLSLGYLILFALSIIVIIFYAIGWQLILKKFPLSSAYLNKSVVIIWGVIWGAIVFHEKIDAGIIMGGCLIMAGVSLVARE